VNNLELTRRAFVGGCASLPLLLQAKRKIPVGLELYSVRNELKNDLPGTIKTVAGDGYQCVEFFAPYHDWTVEYSQQVRKILDAAKIHCYSTHNSIKYFEPDQLQKTIDLNQAIGARFAIVASAGDPKTLDGWKQVAQKLNDAAAKLAPHNLHTGYHNHEVEFTPLDGTRPIEVIAKNTVKDITLQLDVGTCLAAGADPVAWIKQNPGRIRIMHCKDWSKEQGYKVLFGEGSAPWKDIFAAAESKGGIEFYLIEQEGSRYSEFDTAKRCLEEFRKVHG
jgi:sugar phosphate isomerase/epimerase